MSVTTSTQAHSDGDQDWWGDRKNDGTYITVSEWATHYQVIPELVPFAQRERDPIEIVGSIRDVLDDMPVTSATGKASGMFEKIGIPLREVPNHEDYLALAGMWKFDPDATAQQRSTRWVNPHYVHAKQLDPSITEKKDRIEHLRHCASLGIFSTADIAPRFGIIRNGLCGWLCKNDIPWNEWREWGRVRLARTAVLIHEWTGTYYKDIASALGLPKSTLTTHTKKRARNLGWEPPSDPSPYRKFGKGSWGGDGD